MIEAFSKAREYWEVALWVKASYLCSQNGKLANRLSNSATPTRRAVIPCKRDFDMIFINGETEIQEF